MPRHVGVMFVHGIGGRNFDFAERMRRALLKLIPRDLYGYVHFKPVYWANVVRLRQREFMQMAVASADILDNRARRFVVEGLGDAAAYQKTRRRENSIYHMVQECISRELELAERETPTLKDSPLIFVGHSLGCHIISSYAWDLNKLKQRTEEDINNEPDDAVRKHWWSLQQASVFRRLDTFAGFVTMGNNMPLFTFTFGPERVFPITTVPKDSNLTPAFPGIALDNALAEKARWLNFFSKKDMLGFPLKALSMAYDGDARIRDICVRSESWQSMTFPFWTYLKAHTGYWTNPIVLRETATMICEAAAVPAR